MNHIIHTKNAPKPIGPYSQAIQINNIIMLSGQIPIDIISGKIPDKIEDQTYIVLKNIKNILKSVNLEIKNIIKMTIFTTDLKKINAINKIYENFFIKNMSHFPARSCIEVQALPKNSKIEIDAIAFAQNKT
ncbi:MAG: hypothetical protein ICW73_01100 [Buchnera aphidicola (Pentalonia nigronervosa)]|jgi:2-iminobutanoate/2-iminopropanoate deaminase|uniref:Reactive intermediate/imine deaminase n=1 Tax=Buchnera aphidicola (Pentalonia nigronervosa) TaxID=1309793 RepID=A0A7H1AZY9_9GAMM|nr:MAG: hypothetical protein ICW73_01100 [Buchnera aphidicola (Pentalonia nigronervosa)]